MDKVIIASTRKSAGKTSVIVGIAGALKKNFGYMKPFGDRLLYRKKQSWDYDSALILKVYGLKENPEHITIEFDHANLRYIYDEEKTKEKLLKIASNIGENKDILFVEGGKDLTYGASVHLDALSIANCMDGKLLIVISGNDDSIVDDITFVKKYVDMGNVGFGGVILNKVHDVEDFKNAYLDTINKMGIHVLGIIPYKKELTYPSVDYLSERLFAKVIAGEGGLNNVVKTIFVGDMSAEVSLRSPLFKKGDKLVITSGDRSDIIQAALDSDTSGIILANNIGQQPNIISKADDRNIPLLLVSSDTGNIVVQIDSMEPLLRKNDASKIALLKQLTKKYVNIQEIADI